MTTAAIVGPGTSAPTCCSSSSEQDNIDVRYMVGVDPASDGLALARAGSWRASSGGVDWLLGRDELPGWSASRPRRPRTSPMRLGMPQAGITAIDPTPAAVGPLLPSGRSEHQPRCGERQHDHLRRPSDHSDGHAVSRCGRPLRGDHRLDISHARLGLAPARTSTNSPRRAAGALQSVGGARQARRAIIILNPVEPPLIMRDGGVLCDSSGIGSRCHHRIGAPDGQRCSNTFPAIGWLPTLSSRIRRTYGEGGGTCGCRSSSKSVVTGLSTAG